VKTTDLNDFVLEGVSCNYVRFITGTNTIDERTWLAEIQLWGYLSTQVKKNFDPDPVPNPSFTIQKQNRSRHP
jgi:hypothetical protein